MSFPHERFFKAITEMPKKTNKNDGYSRSLVNGESALHVYIKAELHYRFALTAFKLGISQREIITQFIEEWLKENEKEKTKGQGPGNKKSG